MIDNALPGVFFDIGANWGYYTAPMSAKATTVYAFEPAETNYGPLVNAVKSFNNVITEKIAVSNSNSIIKLYGPAQGYGQANWGGFTISQDLPVVCRDRSFENYEEVPSITLDEYCSTNGITNITGMKIDVESAEQFVLEGAMQTLKSNNILISLETHVAINCQRIYELLTEAGYSVYHNGTTLVTSMNFDQQYICRK